MIKQEEDGDDDNDDNLYDGDDENQFFAVFVLEHGDNLQFSSWADSLW